MLSAIKNFLVTFLIAALIFGTGAYFATRFLTDTISGIFDVEADELDAILNAGTETSKEDSAVTEAETSDVLAPDPEDVIEGSTFDMLFIVTDYQPDIYSDYLPDADQLAAMENNTEATGILGTKYRRPRACAVLLLRADLEQKKFILTPFSSITRVQTSAGYCTLADLYNLYDHKTILDEVSSMTGLALEHYLLVNITELSDIMMELGSISLYLSRDLYYNGQISTTVKPTGEQADLLPLLYTIGKHEIDGPGAVALMMNEDYSNGVTERNAFLVTFFTEILNKLVSGSEAQFTDFYDTICEKAWIETTFTPKELVSQMELIRAFGSEEFETVTVDYPGRFVPASETEPAYYEPDIKAGLTRFRTYRPHETANIAP